MRFAGAGPAARHEIQPGGRIPERTGDVDIVAHRGATAGEHAIRVDIAEHLQGDRQRPADRVAADEFDAVLVRKRKKTLCERLEPGVIRLGERQRQGAPARRCTHGGQVAQIHRQCPVTDRVARQPVGEVDPGDQRIRGSGRGPAGLQDGGIVADSKHHAWIVAFAGEVAIDHLEFVQGARAVFIHAGCSRVSKRCPARR